MKMFEMMKQMQQVRKIQKQLAAKKVEITSTDKMITVVACGDMSIASIKINPEAVASMKLEKLERLLASTVNGALDSSKKAAAADMQKITGGMGGLAEMLGGGGK